eukprot:TRINITY_DN1102_c0_g1_i9.p1 TRINITY_DN1102_c0_g1~~TRINITY_DN1102_c0_g1_i9.p1  ORF type:complete len:208 (-),score=-31.46 TRINITY_DN1102_c0_g1_i9:228-851(-)
MKKIKIQKGFLKINIQQIQMCIVLYHTLLQFINVLNTFVALEQYILQIYIKYTLQIQIKLMYFNIIFSCYIFKQYFPSFQYLKLSFPVVTFSNSIFQVFNTLSLVLNLIQQFQQRQLDDLNIIIRYNSDSQFSQNIIYHILSSSRQPYRRIQYHKVQIGFLIMINYNIIYHPLIDNGQQCRRLYNFNHKQNKNIYTIRQNKNIYTFY